MPHHPAEGLPEQTPVDYVNSHRWITRTTHPNRDGLLERRHTDENMPFEVRRLGRTIGKLRDQIVARLEAHVSNGPTEARQQLDQTRQADRVRLSPVRPLPHLRPALRRLTQLVTARHHHSTLKREAPVPAPLHRSITHTSS